MENQDDAMSDLRRILADRDELYTQAHASIDTNGKNIDECVAELISLAPNGLQNNMNEAQDA